MRTEREEEMIHCKDCQAWATGEIGTFCGACYGKLHRHNGRDSSAGVAASVRDSALTKAVYAAFTQAQNGYARTLDNAFSYRAAL